MSEIITSRQNERVKEAAKLRSARQRAKQGRFLIDGAREIGRAIDTGIDVIEAFVCKELCNGEEARIVERRLAAERVSLVTPEVFQKLSFRERHDGIFVVARTPERLLENLVLPLQPLVAVLVGLEKPGNIGAILRTADGAGIDATVVVDGGTDLFNPHTIRASLGTVFNANVCTASIADTVTKLREWQLTIVVTRPDATRLYTEVDYFDGAAIVLGNEATGISPMWPEQFVTTVHLPMQGIADSLNVSVTGAIMFYEAVRQRNLQEP